MLSVLVVVAAALGAAVWLSCRQTPRLQPGPHPEDQITRTIRGDSPGGTSASGTGSAPGCWRPGTCTFVGCGQSYPTLAGEDTFVALRRHLWEAHGDVEGCDTQCPSAVVAAVSSRFAGARVVAISPAKGGAFEVELRTQDGAAPGATFAPDGKVLRDKQPVADDALPEAVARLAKDPAVRWFRARKVTGAGSELYSVVFSKPELRAKLAPDGVGKAVEHVGTDGEWVVDPQGSVVESREFPEGTLSR